MAAKRDAMLAAGPRAQRSTLLEHYMGARLADGDDLDTHFLSVRRGLHSELAVRVLDVLGQHAPVTQGADGLRTDIVGSWRMLMLVLVPCLHSGAPFQLM